MRFPTIALATLLVFGALSGCFGDSGGTKSTTDAASSTGPSTTSPAGGNGTGQDPTADISVLKDGTALEGANGSLSVEAGMNLTFDGSASSDPDGGNLTYAWDLGDGTTASNATVEHAFAAGAYNVTLTVTDDEGATARAFVLVNVTGGASGGVAYFVDEEGTAQWTYVRQIMIYDNIVGVGGERIITQNHPTSQGWHVTTAAKANGTKSYTMQTEADEGYHDNEYTAMVSPEIDLTAATTANLTFQVTGDAEANNYEGLYWDISTDGGSTWTNLGSTKSSASANIAKWEERYKDISAHAGKKIKIRFLFKSDSSCSAQTDIPDLVILRCGAHGSYKGYFIDDIRIKPL